MKIIDSHTHIGSCMSAIHFSKKSYSVEELINEMDQNCVDRSVVMGGGRPYQIMYQNELIKKAFLDKPPLHKSDPRSAFERMLFQLAGLAGARKTFRR